MEEEKEKAEGRGVGREGEVERHDGDKVMKRVIILVQLFEPEPFYAAVYASCMRSIICRRILGASMHQSSSMSSWREGGRQADRQKDRDRQTEGHRQSQHRTRERKRESLTDTDDESEERKRKLV